MGKSAAKGTILNVNSVAVGSLSNIDGLEPTMETIDVTTLDSSGGYREFVGGLKDGGELPVDGYLNAGDAGQTAIQAAFDAGVAVPCSIVFPATIGYTWTFNGLVTGFKTGAALEDAVSFSATIKVSGKPTLAASVTISVLMQPVGLSFVSFPFSLFVGATVSSGSITYQWYSNDENTTVGASAMPGEIFPVLYMDSGVDTTTYYFCVLSVAGGASVTTDIAEVEFLD